jgi:hypothetical protein
MTRKDFELIAAALKASRVDRPTDSMIVQHRFTCRIMADDLARTNPGFKPDRFMEACGYQEG